MATLHLIGSGTPTPTKERHGTCHILEIDGEFLMFDCGPASTHKLVKAGLWPTKINYLFITHHHFDHFVDYPCFLLVRWDQSVGKEKPLRIFGPPLTRQITERLIGPQGAFVSDWTARVSDPVSQHVFMNRGGTLPRPAPNYQVTEIGHGPVVKTDKWSVTAGFARHQEPWLNSLAYRVDAQGVSVVFAGDGEPCEPLAKLAAGCDVLVANTWDTQEAMDSNGEGPGQTGTLDAAKMAVAAGAKMLVMTHTGPRLCGQQVRQKEIAQMAEVFNGRIIFGEELMAIQL
ncbi:MAG: MBL fold metallo-hydrolase [Phycisphaerae bacterium]